MKRVIEIFGCAGSLIKKFFLNEAKNDISHDYERLLGLTDSLEFDGTDTDTNIEEYENTYNSTTRWQTV